MLMTFVLGVKPFQQCSHDVPWDLLVLVDQRLDRLLHLHNKTPPDKYVNVPRQKGYLSAIRMDVSQRLHLNLCVVIRLTASTTAQEEGGFTEAQLHLYA